MTAPGLPPLLADLVRYLQKQQIELVAGGDARTNSANSEIKVISTLQNALDHPWRVATPNTRNNRHWYDFTCQDGDSNQEYYCDIKISKCRSYDNMNAKKAIYWLLTGDEETHKVPDQNKQFFERLRMKENLSEERDFYYLVINKSDTSDVFMVSLKNINSVAINGSPNNPPFQANWYLARSGSQYRTVREAKDFFLGQWAEVISKNMEILRAGMPRFYPEYFKHKDFE